MSKITPMIQQYLDIKRSYSEYLLLYRMGDFYELFYDDAITAAPLLNIVLTRRGNDELGIPMCGIPHHSCMQYIGKLVDNGYKVAICEQLETPEEAKKRGGHKAVVRRDVVRIITPGTILENNLMEAKSSNYIASVGVVNQEISIAYADISTGEFYIMASSEKSLLDDLVKIDVKEILISNKISGADYIKPLLQVFRSKASILADSLFDFLKTFNRIKHHFNLYDDQKSLNNYSRSDISAAGSLLEYIYTTQKSAIPKLNFPKKLRLELYMKIDAQTLQSLEIIPSEKTGKNSVFEFFNNTVTAAGSRLLRSMFINPLIDIEQINRRLDITEFFYNNQDFSFKIIDFIRELPDFERILARIITSKTNPLELRSFAGGMLSFMNLHSLLSNINLPKDLKTKLENIDTKVFAIASAVNQAIKEDAPLVFKEGGFIQYGFDPVCDKFLDLVNNAEQILAQMLQKYKDLIGISNLKIGYNENIGYYIEASPQAANKVASFEQFRRKQTLVSCSRFITDELETLEKDILHARERLIAKEIEIFTNLCEEIAKLSSGVYQVANCIAILDVYTNLAKMAVKHSYTRPKLNNDGIFALHSAFHPVISATLSNKHMEFQKNDTYLDNMKNIGLITGPNMAGKSTYLKQNAIIAVLAQIGSFVPAMDANICVFDAVFSRIGAGDDILRGQSTFMVEMSETARIFQQATSRSLIIIDELGRGTSTFDGMAIATACLEYIHNKLKAKCLFATHYHELAKLEDSLYGLFNLTVLIEEGEDSIEFLHKIIPGNASKSYGIYVAKIAGVPTEIIEKSKKYLNQLENNASSIDNVGTVSNTGMLEDHIKSLDIDSLSPKDALETLYRLRSLLVC